MVSMSSTIGVMSMASGFVMFDGFLKEMQCSSRWFAEWFI